MIAFTVVLGWLLVGAASVTYAIYRDKRAFWTYGSRDEFFLTVGVLGGPITVFAIACKHAFLAADAARENKARIAAELEKELAAARREIESMLKGGAE